jgi:hypothetical protein
MNPSLFASAILLGMSAAAFTGTNALAAMHPACSIVSLAEVESAVGGPIKLAFSIGPTTSRGATLTECAYTSGDKESTAPQLSAAIVVNSASPALIARAKRHFDDRANRAMVSSVVRGSMLVMAQVHRGRTFDEAASKKLLAQAIDHL